MINNNAYIIDVKNLNKSFNGKSAVIDFSLQLQKGEVCGFLGPNGSGKTTILRMLCGLLTPDSGSGQCLGYDILTQSFAIKTQIGYMTQSFSLYGDLTAYENLDLIGRVYQIKNRKARIEEEIKKYDLTDYRNQLTSHMSGGWKQRLALAGCMLHNPQLLLLDEPTAGVDPRARREFWDNIFHLSHQGVTTLVSTHYMDEAERCTKLVYISYAHIIATGTISEIIKQAQLTTWLVKGNGNLMELEEKLRGLPGVDQVEFFGEKLHVSGRDEALLDKSITPYKTEYWSKITSSLEDAFISLVDKSEEKV